MIEVIVIFILLLILLGAVFDLRRLRSELRESNRTISIITSDRDRLRKVAEALMERQDSEILTENEYGILEADSIEIKIYEGKNENSGDGKSRN